MPRFRLRSISLLAATLGLSLHPSGAQTPAPSQPTAQDVLAEMKAINDRMREQVAKQVEVPGNRTAGLPIPPQRVAAGRVSVPSRTAKLIRALEANLGDVPATVVIDGSYVEVFVVKPSPRFIKALAAASNACKGDYDLQVEQIGTTEMSPAAEAYRKQIQEAGAPETGLALVSRWSERMSIRFAFAPRRIPLIPKVAPTATPALATKAPEKPDATMKVVNKITTPKSEPTAATKQVSAAKPAPIKPTVDENEPSIGEIMVAPPEELTRATKPDQSAPPAAVAPAIPEAGSIPQSTAPPSVAAAPAANQSVQRSGLPEPDVIVIELPRDRGRVKEATPADVMGVISVTPQ